MPDAATITSRDICNQAVVERILADDSVSSIKVAANLESDNYDGGTIATDPGTVGWRIERNTGDAVFNDGIFRGDLAAATITGVLRSAASGRRVEVDSATDSAQITFPTGDGSETHGGLVYTQDSGGEQLVAASPKLSGGGVRIAFNEDGPLVLEGFDTPTNDYSQFNHQVRVQDGSASAVSIRKSGANDGIYFSSGVIHFGLTGAEKFRVGNEGGQTIGGSAGSPSWSFISDNNTGIYNGSGDELNLAAGGVEMLRLVESTDDQVMVGPQGSESAPSLAWINDPDTGFYNSTANQISGVVGGTEKLRVGASIFVADEVYNQTTANAANVHVFSSGQMSRSTSLLKYKRNPRAWTVTDDEWERLTSYEWESKLPVDHGATFRGFIWDWLPERFRAQTNEDLRAIVGALIQRVKALEAA